MCGCGSMCMCGCTCGCGCMCAGVGACICVGVGACICVGVVAYVWVHVYVCGYPGQMVVKRDVFCYDNLYYGLLLISNLLSSMAVYYYV